MYDPDKYQSKAARSQPLQARGKERVRIILAAALKAFQQEGFVEANTNSIAQRAGIPIGSLYRYYPNKNALLLALANLYVEDVSELFAATAKHPLFGRMEWDEVMLLTIDSWLNYVMLNGPFDFLYSAKANPPLGALTQGSWAQLSVNFNILLRAHCSRLTDKQVTVAFRFALAAVGLGSDIGFGKNHEARPETYYEAVQVIAGYMRGACEGHGHS